MRLWKKPSKSVNESLSSIEVVDIKRKSNATITQTNNDIKRLNKLLKANGITLKIHIATQEKNHA
jgi:hypothetical protein